MSQPSRESLTVVESQNGQGVSLRSGESFTLVLSENPTTGFRWGVAELDPQHLALLSSDYRMPPQAGVGAGGERRFVLQAKQPGTTRLRLKLAREFESDQPAMQLFEISVAIAK